LASIRADVRVGKLTDQFLNGPRTSAEAWLQPLATRSVFARAAPFPDLARLLRKQASERSTS
jgi:hypothetical protein